MTENEVVEHVCNLPRIYAAGGHSPVAIVKESGYFQFPGAVTRERITAVLMADKSLVEEWLNWSDNKRGGGWYFQKVPPSRWWFGRKRDKYLVSGSHTGMKFSDTLEACAEYILREIACLAERAREA